jgi:hypothetical protein
MIGFKIQFQIAAFSNDQAIVQGFWDMGEGREHFFRVFVIQLASVKTHAPRIVNAGAGLNAQEDVVGVYIIGIQIMAVVGSHQGQPGFAGKVNEPLIKGGLLGQAVFLQLQIKTPGKYAAVLLNCA